MTLAALLVLAAGAIQLVAGALATGVTLDEPLHAERAASWLEEGWYVPGYLLADGRPDPGNALASPHVYGPGFAGLAHLANAVAGNEALGEISRSAGAYAVRHLTSAVLALLAAAAVAAAVTALTRSRRFGLWAAAGLLAVPEWTGQAFFNPKDTPAAAGYAFLTAGLVLALSETEAGPASGRRRLAIGGLLAAGFLIGAGTRLPLLLPFVASLLTYAAIRLGQRRLGGIERPPDTDVAVAAGAGLGVAAIAVLYPKVASSPLEFLGETVSGSSDYPWQGVTLTAGQLLSEHPPWWYLPAWIGAAVPLLLGALAVLGAVAGARAILAARGARWRGPLWARRDLGLVLVLQQALLLPLAAILAGAVMYSGMRQHLYVLPALAILAGAGAWHLWGWAARRSPPGRWRGGVAALLSLALLVPMAEQALLFPYNYAYVNPVAGIGGVEDRWEADYWVASAPEALSHVPEEAPLQCLLVPPSVPCKEDQLAPFADRRGTDVDERWRDAAPATWLILRRHAGNPPLAGCEDTGDVTRWLRGERITMSYVLRCP